MMRKKKILVTAGILAVGLLVTLLIKQLSPTAVPVTREAAAPLVRVSRVTPDAIDFSVQAQGTVTPRTESDLVPQVSGPVVWVSPALASGGFFERDEPLIRIERDDYEVALESARAAVARAKSENSRAEVELKRQDLLAKQSVASASRYDDAVNAGRVAAATLREVVAMLDRAVRDLERTEILAPYAGRVRRENVDVGQFVTRGTSVAKIYAVDYAEVRLPIPDAELGYLDLPLLYRGEDATNRGPEVELSARFAGRDHTWTGRVVRTEGEIDPNSRMVTVVVQVDDPYGRNAAGGPQAGADERPPLAVGLFVNARISGRRIERAFVLPRTALRGGDRVLVVDDDGHMHYRDVEILRSQRNQIVVGSGLAPDEDVVVSPLNAVIDGMKVRITRDEPDQASLAGSSDGPDLGGRSVARTRP